ncbi:MAG: histidinol dehydrogenase, partial [Rhizobium sp.]
MAIWLEQVSDGFEERFAAFLTTKREVSEDVNDIVRAIIDDVRARGDEALADYSRRFDGIDFSQTGMRVTAAEIDAAVKLVDPTVMDALRLAAERIEKHHARQMPKDDIYEDALGVGLGSRWTAIDAVGLYVPGGTASYPSSVLMNAVPARVAGVPRIVMVVPASGGEINPTVLAAARIAGVEEIYR